MGSAKGEQTTVAKSSRRKTVTPPTTAALADAPVTVSEENLSHNLYGQRLGRKGRDTRDKIIAAAQTLLARPDAGPITLSAVAREVPLGMTTLYLYFSDLTELLLAVLEPVMATAEDAYLGAIRTRWDDDRLAEECYAFMLRYHEFWARHTQVLHLRNAMADQHDRRMLLHRVQAATDLINLVVRQMDGDPAETQSRTFDMATVLMTGVERVVTMATSTDVHDVIVRSRPIPGQRMEAVARLMELAIREHRPGGPACVAR
ncbi:MAG TPA: TetR/AcrR family transcriptional regulator [Sphingobium sp.]